MFSDCGGTGPITDGTFIGTTYFGGSAEVVCAFGYDGSGTATCLPTGDWDSLPTCVPTG